MALTMLNWFRGVLGWIRDLFPGAGWKVAYVEDAPERPRKGQVYIVGGRQNPFQAMMACPCGCGSPIWLDLVPGHGPSWMAKAGAGGVATLDPSVWRTDGCRSHFVLRRGKVQWC